MTTPDHAAALAKLDAGATIPHDLANALYRAGVELEAARLSRALVDTDEKEERFYLALIAFDAALAAVADKITQQGETDERLRRLQSSAAVEFRKHWPAS